MAANLTVVGLLRVHEELLSPFLHDFAGNGEHNVLRGQRGVRSHDKVIFGVLQSWLCRPYSLKLASFYRATRMHSADYAVARCLSVRPSVTSRYCVLTVIHILNIFSLSGSPTILVFPHQTRRQYYDGTPPPNRSVECKGAYEIIAIFDQYLTLSRK